MMAKATADPLAALKSRTRRVTPKVLRGDSKKLWDEFVQNYANEEYAGIPMTDLYEWAKEHCKLTCSLSCFRQALIEQAENRP